MLVKLRNKKEITKYVDQWWGVLEASFEKLFGVTPMTDAQKKYYTKKYFGFVDPDFMVMVVDRHDRLQGFFLGLPSLSRSFQKAHGRLFPFGFLAHPKGIQKIRYSRFLFCRCSP